MSDGQRADNENDAAAPVREGDAVLTDYFYSADHPSVNIQYGIVMNISEGIARVRFAGAGERLIPVLRLTTSEISDAVRARIMQEA